MGAPPSAHALMSGVGLSGGSRVHSADNSQSLWRKIVMAASTAVWEGSIADNNPSRSSIASILTASRSRRWMAGRYSFAILAKAAVLWLAW